MAKQCSSHVDTQNHIIMLQTKPQTKKRLKKLKINEKKEKKKCCDKQNH